MDDAVKYKIRRIVVPTLRSLATNALTKPRRFTYDSGWVIPPPFSMYDPDMVEAHKAMLVDRALAAAEAEA
jgi:hypothetical protein